jgi:hypothetical protein
MADAQLTGLQLVAFRDVLENVVQASHAGLQELVDRLPALADGERCVLHWPCLLPAM